MSRRCLAGWAGARVSCVLQHGKTSPRPCGLQSTAQSLVFPGFCATQELKPAGAPA